jgi:hypothetical protein
MDDANQLPSGSSWHRELIQNEQSKRKERKKERGGGLF